MTNTLQRKLNQVRHEKQRLEEEIEREALEAVIEYVARNPERAGLVVEDQFASYAFTGCVIPGYPQMRLFEADSWERLWRTISFLKRTECLPKSRS